MMPRTAVRATAAAAAAHASPARRAFAPELVIFDKDGTLICFKTMWATWAERLCSDLERCTHLDESAMEVFTDALGFCRRTMTVHNKSILCCSPMQHVKSICVEKLAQGAGLSQDEAAGLVQSVWRLPDPKETAKERTDLVALFESLTSVYGMKIAVCTTDDRVVTQDTLRYLGVDRYVSAVLCGDDEYVEPKPSPAQIEYICDQLGADPQRTIMVGDTITDMRMGASAQVGLNVGVRDGAGSVEDLMEHADFILPSMDHFERVVSRVASPRSM